ncbi:hypothetical protein [Arthrobacter sp. StoSoilB20]|uniref:hypothetical protein n=1 Tax=Arthrobacter sp. StoSoilB20 TaxID=2830995 RepID=UPI001CC80C6B|nr:hypothetical protein [Arthrobacter sp. StoSoilB20]BCW58516.1 hypothetical protein StoSoilB20_18630 [Arthrobacter sp. StoSoilB20]
MVEQFQKQYASPAAMKLYGGARHFRDLEREIGDWTENNPILAPTRPFSGEANSYEMFMPDKPEIPLLEWGSRFGDAVHNLRAALDLLAFELCHLEGVGPQKPTEVYFPVLDDSRKWNNKIKPLASIPFALLQRIADVQPWHADDPAAHVLTLVTALDNLDKHRSTVGMLALPGNVTPPRLHPMPDSATADLWGHPWFTASFDSETPLKDVRWPALWQVEPMPMVCFHDRMTLMVPLQRWLYQETDRIFRYIVSGTWPKFGDLPEPEWVSLPPFPS